MAEPKTKRNAGSVDEFLNKVADARVRQDCQELVKLMGAVTGEPPEMWGASIVGFGAYHYKYASGQEADWPVIGFSPRKQNITLYIVNGFTEYDGLMGRLGKHSTGKSCLYIKRLSDVDPAVLRELVTRSVAHMRAKHG